MSRFDTAAVKKAFGESSAEREPAATVERAGAVTKNYGISNQLEQDIQKQKSESEVLAHVMRALIEKKGVFLSPVDAKPDQFTIGKENPDRPGTEMSFGGVSVTVHDDDAKRIIEEALGEIQHTKGVEQRKKESALVESSVEEMMQKERRRIDYDRASMQEILDQGSLNVVGEEREREKKYLSEAISLLNQREMEIDPGLDALTEKKEIVGDAVVEALLSEKIRLESELEASFEVEHLEESETRRKQITQRMAEISELVKPLLKKRVRLVEDRMRTKREMDFFLGQLQTKGLSKDVSANLRADAILLTELDQPVEFPREGFTRQLYLEKQDVEKRLAELEKVSGTADRMAIVEERAQLEHRKRAVESIWKKMKDNEEPGTMDRQLDKIDTLRELMSLSDIPPELQLDADAIYNGRQPRAAFTEYFLRRQFGEQDIVEGKKPGNPEEARRRRDQIADVLAKFVNPAAQREILRRVAMEMQATKPE